MLNPWKESYDQPRQHIKKQRHYIASQGPSIQCYGVPFSHVWMWELDYKESWAVKNWRYFFLFSVLFIYLLYNIVLVLSYIYLNLPWVYICSTSWTSLGPPSPSHPGGSSQCPSPERHVSCIEPGLAIRFTCDNLHVSIHSPISSHHHPFPQSPKDCSIHLSLLLSRIQGYCYHLYKFRIYALVYCIGVFLSGLLHSV